MADKPVESSEQTAIEDINDNTNSNLPLDELTERLFDLAVRDIDNEDLELPKRAGSKVRGLEEIASFSLPCEDCFANDSWDDEWTGPMEVVSDDAKVTEVSDPIAELTKNLDIPEKTQVELICRQNLESMLNVVINQSGRILQMLCSVFATGKSIIDGITSIDPNLNVKEISESESEDFVNGILWELSSLFEDVNDVKLASKLLELDTQIMVLTDLVKIKLEGDGEFGRPVMFVTVNFKQHKSFVVEVVLEDPAKNFNNKVTNTMLRFSAAFDLIERIIMKNFALSVEPKNQDELMVEDDDQ